MLSKELQIKQFIQENGLDPSNIIYSEYDSNESPNDRSLFKQTFEVLPNLENSLLLPLAFIEYEVRIINLRLRNPPDRSNFIPQTKISLKSGMPFANTMDRILLRINNGETFQLDNVNHWTENFLVTHIGRDDIGKHFPSRISSNDDSFTNYILTDAQVIISANDRWDPDIFMNEMNLVSNIQRSGLDFNQGQDLFFNICEPLLIPPFNPFYNFTKKMTDNHLFKNLSPMIPRVRRINLEIFFATLRHGLLRQWNGGYDSQNDGNGGVNIVNQTEVDGITSKLHLVWYKRPKSYIIPKSINLPLWYNRSFIHPIQDLNASKSVQFNFLFDKIPLFFIIHAERSKTDADYKCQPWMSYDLNTGGVPASRLQAVNFPNSFDTFLSLTSFNMRVNGIEQLHNLTQNRLYDITVKNTYTLDFPYDVETFFGKRYHLEDEELFHQPITKTFLILTPLDLGLSEKSKIYNCEINLTGDIRNTIADNAVQVVNKYHLCVTLFYNDKYLEISDNDTKVMRIK